MDQTKFINSYINNLAEQVKAMSLDNIMLKTQLSMANEQIQELTAALDKAVNKDSKSSKKQTDDWENGSFNKE
jgi:hypothetical protein